MEKDYIRISDREHLFIFFAPFIFAVVIFASVSKIKNEIECREVARNGGFEVVTGKFELLSRDRKSHEYLVNNVRFSIHPSEHRCGFDNPDITFAEDKVLRISHWDGQILKFEVSNK